MLLEHAGWIIIVFLGLGWWTHTWKSRLTISCALSGLPLSKLLLSRRKIWIILKLLDTESSSPRLHSLLIGLDDQLGIEVTEAIRLLQNKFEAVHSVLPLDASYVYRALVVGSLDRI